MEKDNSNNKRIAKNTFYLYVRMLFVMAVTLYTSRVVLATLGETDYGLYNVIGGVVTAFTFISMALSNASSRFITYALGKGDNEYTQKVFNTAFLIHIALALFLFVVAETIGLWFLNSYMNIPPERMHAANWVYQFSIMTTMTSTIGIPFNSAIIAHERMDAYAYISIFDVIMRLVIVYLLLVSSWDRLAFYAFLLLLLQIIDFSFYFLYSHKQFKEVKIVFIKDLTILKEMSGFAGWSIIGNLAYVCYTHGLNVLLNIFFGPVVNAARGIAVQVQSAIKNFVVNFQTAVNPQITKSFAEGNLERMKYLIFVSSRLSFMIMFCLVLPIFLEIKMILSIWLTATPEHTIAFIRLILLVSLIDCFERPLTNAMNATGKIRKYQIVTCTILLLIIPISYILLKNGLPSEIVFVVQFFIMAISCIPEFFILRGYIGISARLYFKEVICPVIVVVLLSSIVPFVLHMKLSEGLTSSIIIISVSILSVLICAYFMGMKDGERRYVNNIIQKFIKFKK